MSFEWVRRNYGVPAKRGARVRFDYDGTREGVIVRADNYIHVRFDGERESIPLHPTWRVTYLEGVKP